MLNIALSRSHEVAIWDGHDIHFLLDSTHFIAHIPSCMQEELASQTNNSAHFIAHIPSCMQEELAS